MLSWIWPWFAAILPLPLLYRWVRKPEKSASAALRVPQGQYQVDPSATKILRGNHPWRLLLLTIAWLCLVAALCRPTWVGEPIRLPAEARDLLLAVDISMSMVKNQDMELDGRMVDRLIAVKKVVGEFVERRTGDRMGLILFGSEPYLQTPLTFDRHTLNQLLTEARAGFAGPQTAIGDAIGLAVKRLRERPAAMRVLILLTDGANTAGEVEPLQAAELAAKEDIKIYTIGIGAESLEMRDLFFTRRVNPSADLDEKTLSGIAELTGGQYFRARNPEELQQIYELLDQLEPVEQEAEVLRPSKALYYWPLGAAFVALSLLALASRRELT